MNNSCFLKTVIECTNIKGKPHGAPVCKISNLLTGIILYGQIQLKKRNTFSFLSGEPVHTLYSI